MVSGGLWFSGRPIRRTAPSKNPFVQFTELHPSTSYSAVHGIFINGQCSVQSRSVPIVYRAVWLCTKSVQHRFISLNVH